MLARESARPTVEPGMKALLLATVEVWVPCPRIKCGAGKHGATWNGSSVNTP